MNGKERNWCASLCALAGILLLACCTLSCSSDDDDNKNGDGNGVTLPQPEQWGIARVDTVDYFWAPLPAVYHYDDEGRITSGRDGSTINFDFTITYNPLEMRVIAHGDSVSEETRFYNILTNSQGFITAFDLVTEQYKNGLLVGENKSHSTLTYDADNHQTSISSDGQMTNNGNIWSYKALINTQWENDNIVKVEKYGEQNGNVTHDETYTFAYDDNAVPNNGVFLYEAMYFPNMLYYAGFMGRPSRLIPTSLEERKPITKWEENYVFDVTTDEQGRITKMGLTSDGGTYYDYGKFVY